MTQSVMRKGWVPILKIKVTVWAEILRTSCFFHISWTSEPFATKLGIVVHHHEPEYCVTILDYCPQGQGHSEGWHPQGMSSELKSHNGGHLTGLGDKPKRALSCSLHHVCHCTSALAAVSVFMTDTFCPAVSIPCLSLIIMFCPAVSIPCLSVSLIHSVLQSPDTMSITDTFCPAVSISCLSLIHSVLQFPYHVYHWYILSCSLHIMFITDNYVLSCSLHIMSITDTFCPAVSIPCLSLIHSVLQSLYHVYHWYILSCSLYTMSITDTFFPAVSCSPHTMSITDTFCPTVSIPCLSLIHSVLQSLYQVYHWYILSCSLHTIFIAVTFCPPPKGGQRFLMSPPCLEHQGCQFSLQYINKHYVLQSQYHFLSCCLHQGSHGL